jgi:predicted RNA-binding Zn ribbon-like protein
VIAGGNSGEVGASTAAEQRTEPLCIRFVNTLDWRNDAGRRAENLTSYSDLLQWARSANLLTHDEARRLLDCSRSQQAQRVLSRALDFRECLYRIFSAVAAHRAPAEGDLDTLNRAHAEAATHMEIVRESDGSYTWRWRAPDDALDLMLWPVARSAAELLISGPLDRVRECERGGCGWIFVDTTRNRSRRWCAMRVCGNRSKVERYYRRHKKTP